MLLAVLVFVISAHVFQTASASATYICQYSSGKVKTAFASSTKTKTVQTQVVAPNGDKLQVNVECEQEWDVNIWEIRSCSPETAQGLKIATGESYTISVKDSYYAMKCNQEVFPSLTDTFMDFCKPLLDDVWSKRAKNGYYKPSRDDKKRTVEREYSVAVPGADGVQLQLSLTVACLATSPTIRGCTYKGGNRFLDSVSIEAGSEANILYADREYRLKCSSRAYPQISIKDETSYIEKTCKNHLEAEQDKNTGASLKSLVSSAKDSYTRDWELEWTAADSDIPQGCSCKTVKEMVRIAYSCYGAAPKIRECRRGLVGLTSVNAGGSIDFRCSRVVNKCAIGCSADDVPTLSCNVDRNSPAFPNRCH